MQLSKAAPEVLLSVLQRYGPVSFLATLKPGCAIDQDAWRARGFDVCLASPHFVWRPASYGLQQSAKTRRNVRIGRDRWSVVPCDIQSHASELAALYADLFGRREMSAVLNYPLAHFAGLGMVPGMEMLGAFDPEGLGAFLIYGRWKQEVHTLHLVGGARSHRTCAAYALLQELWEREHAETTLYLGGAPRSHNGPGIARFKQRFANTTLTPLLVRAILDPARCDALRELRGSHEWFPPYRSQYGD